MKKNLKEFGRKKRHERIRRKVKGTEDRPRLSVHRSHRNLVCQVIDDVNEKTIFAFSTFDKDFKQASPKGSTVDSGKTLGKVVIEKMKKKGISKVAFDRAGYRYHGRIQALTEALREGGIQF